MNFPNFLPNPTTDLSGTVDNKPLRSEMESGRTRQRRRFTSEFNSIPASWDFDASQFGMFKAWFRHKISNGNDFFNISLPVDGFGFKEFSVRFVGAKYSWSHYGFLNYTVRATLECESPMTISESDYDALTVAGDVVAIEECAAELAATINRFSSTLPNL